MSYATELTRQMMELLESRHELHGIVIIQGKGNDQDHFALCRNGRISRSLCNQVICKRQVSRKEELLSAKDVLKIIAKLSLHPCGNCLSVLGASL